METLCYKERTEENYDFFPIQVQHNSPREKSWMYLQCAIDMKILFNMNVLYIQMRYWPQLSSNTEEVSLPSTTSLFLNRFYVNVTISYAFLVEGELQIRLHFDLTSETLLASLSCHLI